MNSDTEHNVSSRLREQDINHPDLRDLLEPSHAYPDKQNGLPLQLSNLEQGHEMKQETESYSTKDGKPFYSSAIKSHLLQGPLIDEGLKKNDSFTRWMSKALDDVKEFQMQSNSETYWDTVEGENGIDVSSIPPQAQLDSYLLGPSISQDQLFSIIDFSPNWAYEHSEIKVCYKSGALYYYLYYNFSLRKTIGLDLKINLPNLGSVGFNPGCPAQWLETLLVKLSCIKAAVRY